MARPRLLVRRSRPAGAGADLSIAADHCCAGIAGWPQRTALARIMVQHIYGRIHLPAWFALVPDGYTLRTTLGHGARLIAAVRHANDLATRAAAERAVLDGDAKDLAGDNELATGSRAAVGDRTAPFCGWVSRRRPAPLSNTFLFGGRVCGGVLCTGIIVNSAGAIPRRQQGARGDLAGQRLPHVRSVDEAGFPGLYYLAAARLADIVAVHAADAMADPAMVTQLPILA